MPIHRLDWFVRQGRFQRTGCQPHLQILFQTKLVGHHLRLEGTLIDQLWKIMSIARRDWAVAGHLLRGLGIRGNR